MKISYKLEFAGKRLGTLCLGFVLFFWLALLSVFAGAAGCFLFGLLNPRYDAQTLFQTVGWVMLVVFLVTVLTGGIARRPGWLLCKDSLRFYGWASLIVFSLVVLYSSIEKWRGKRAWAVVQTEMTARGERPGMDFIVDASVPAELDAAKTGVFAALSHYEISPEDQWIWQDQKGYQALADIHNPLKGLMQRWMDQQCDNLTVVDARVGERLPQSETPRTEILRQFDSFTNQLDQIREASRLPYARFKINYGNSGNTYPNPQVRVLCGIHATFVARALAELGTEKPAEALEDARCALRLCRLISQQPTRQGPSLTLLSMQPIWEGLAARQWSSEQIAALQAELDPMCPLTGFQTEVKMKCWSGMDFIDQIFPITTRSGSSIMDSRANKALLFSVRMIVPRGWSYQVQAGLYQQYRESLEVVDSREQRVFLDKMPKGPRKLSLNPFLEVMVVPDMYKSDILNSALAQTSINLARMACALERYRLVEGHYPATTVALVPRFIAKLPADILNGEPLHYELTSEDHFQLNSVGWMPYRSEWSWQYPQASAKR